MYAVGHLALGCLFAEAFQRHLKTKINLPLVFLLSLIPDIDLLISDDVHRGITHSIIVSALVFIPFFVHYWKRSVPYFAALARAFVVVIINALFGFVHRSMFQKKKWTG